VIRKTLKRVVRKKILAATKAKAARAIRRSKTANAVDEVRRPKWAASNFNFYKVETTASAFLERLGK
jgi:hypothetical protein